MLELLSVSDCAVIWDFAGHIIQSGIKAFCDMLGTQGLFGRVLTSSNFPFLGCASVSFWELPKHCCDVSLLLLVMKHPSMKTYVKPFFGLSSIL